MSTEILGAPAAGEADEYVPMSRRKVANLATPIVIEYFLQTLVAAVSTLLISRAGDTALAGVGIATPIMFFFLALFSAVSVGATVLISNAFGARDTDRLNHVAKQSLIWGLVAAIPMSVATYLLTPAVVALFGDDQEVQHAAIEYLQILAIGNVPLLGAYLAGSILRGVSDGKTPLYAALFMNLVNLVACYALIGGELGFPELGIAGAAWASVISRAAGLAILLWALANGRRAVSIAGRNGWWPNGPIGKRLFNLGLPAAFEQISNESGFLATTYIVASLGASALTAQHIGLTALEVWFLPALALEMTAIALVGQSVGARKIEDGVAAARILHRWALGWTVFGTIVLIVFAVPILEAFSTGAEVVDLGHEAMIAIGLCLPLWGLWLTTIGAIRGTGDTRSPMVRGLIAMWSAVALAAVGVYVFDLGLGWTWTAYIIALPYAIVGNWRAFNRRTARFARFGEF